MSKRDWVVEMIVAMLQSAPQGSQVQTAELIVDRLMEEGLLSLGYGDKDVDAIVDSFKSCFGTTKTSKYDRYAARRLAAKHGAQAICGIIRLLADNADAPYAPVVGSVTQIEEKWVSIISFLRKLNDNQVIDA